MWTRGSNAKVRTGDEGVPITATLWPVTFRIRRRSPVASLIQLEPTLRQRRDRNNFGAAARSSPASKTAATTKADGFREKYRTQSEVRSSLHRRPRVPRRQRRARVSFAFRAHGCQAREQLSEPTRSLVDIEDRTQKKEAQADARPSVWRARRPELPPRALPTPGPSSEPCGRG